MKVWSKHLTVADLCECASKVNQEFPGTAVYLEDEIALHEGPRTRRLDAVHLRSRTGRYYPNPGKSGAGALSNFYEGKCAASWTEWGWFIARVLEMDPEARVGDYRGVHDFNRQTNNRFIEPRTRRERQVLVEEARHLGRVA